MPRVKLDYVVSFSSEDPENPASNLLDWELSKKRWLCAKGEPSCSVVLQLTRAVKVSAVHVGGYHAALVEVLVGRSEKPNEPFQVLVPSCIFLSPAESRAGAGAARVRSFSAEQLAAAREQRWDRVRVVCSQPYNKHCKYGLNFVHIFEPEGGLPASGGQPAAPAPPPPAPAPPPPAPAPPPPRARLPPPDAASSDEEFAPGELFAQHRGALGKEKPTTSVADTGAQIRQATSHALKNISDSSTNLVKTPISKPTPKIFSQDQPSSSKRQRNDVMYTDDDDRPHAKIDHIVQRHKDERTKDEAKKSKDYERKKDPNDSVRKDVKKDESQKARHEDRNKDRADKTPKEDKKNRPLRAEEPKSESAGDRSRSERDRKRSRDDRSPRKASGSGTSGPLGSVLRGVVLALSGYVNPRRAALRDTALALGARYERDWGPKCTHLICAFPNTPKLRSVRQAPAGRGVPVARGEWLQACARRGRRLPWRAYATDPRDAEPEEPDDAAEAEAAPADDAECDTDDEIEKALRKQKKRRSSPSPPPGERARQPRSPRPSPARRSPRPSPARAGDARQNESSASDVAFVCDERVKGHIEIDDDDDRTDEENSADSTIARSVPEADAEGIDSSKSLPEIFEGRTFLLDASAARGARALARYVAAYGGLLLQESQLDEDSSVDYVLCGGGGGEGAARGGVRVRAGWLWRCHETRQLCPVGEYQLP